MGTELVLKFPQVKFKKHYRLGGLLFVWFGFDVVLCVCVCGGFFGLFEVVG